MRDDLVSLLEAIAYGDDASVSVDHRLRAAAELRALGAVDEEPSFREIAWRELSDLDDREVQVQLDHTTAALLLCADEELRAEWPETTRAIERLVTARLSDQMSDGRR
jgi:hypothetical protein